MSDAFQIVDAPDAQDFLRSFDAATRQRGESYFQQGRVQPFKEIKKGKSYTTTVEGQSGDYEVNVYYSSESGWEANCTCPVEGDCKHAYAAMKSLLAAHSLAAVRGISSGEIAVATQTHGVEPPEKQPKKPAGPLAAMAAKALERALRPDEAKFCKKVQDLYHRSCQTRHITRWDFDELGLGVGGNGWDALKIWPSFPETELEFWLYIANAADEAGAKWPAFLNSVTDLKPIKERMLRFRRGQQISQWKQTLDHLHGIGTGEGVPASRGEFDLRIAIHEHHAEVEWKKPGQEKFTPAKISHFRQLIEDRRDGRAEMATESSLLSEMLLGRFAYASSTELRYTDSNALTTLGQILRMEALQSRVVTETGEQMTRAPQPLQWQITPAENAQGDYKIALVQADGAPIPPLLVAVPGRPSLFVTENCIFTGPPLREHILDPKQENLIPAPALETHSGLKFLQSLGVELPERIRERVRNVPLNVAITCHLEPVYAGSQNENCVVQVLAETADGNYREMWDGQSWVQVAQSRQKSKVDDSVLIFYDRSVVATVPPLLEPLNLKRDPYKSHLTVRVSKKFPEVFASWLKSMPPHIQVHLQGELASFTESAVCGNVRLDVTETSIDWFDLSVVLDLSDTTLSQDEVKLLLNAKGGYVRLGKKGWRRLQFNLTEEEDERLANLGLTPHQLTSEPQRMHALQLADESAKKFLPAEQAEQIQRRATEIKARVTPDLPRSITAELRPYQLEGFHFLAYLSANRFGGILADDMGLGKTLQTLSWLVWLRDQTAPGTKPKPSLVVCPKSVMDNWHAEAARFASGLRVKSWPAAELDSFTENLDDADLHVLNYNQLRILGENLIPVQWLTVILDEGQYIKNPNSQTTQVARALHAEHRLVLSGTPIENRLLDLWSLMSFAMPGVLSSRAQFGKLFDSKGDPFARKRLAARVRPFLLRRTKTQVAKDLPDRVEEDLFCEIEGEQKTLYRAELKRAQQMLLKVQSQKQLNKERFHFLTSLLRLRQICCHPALVSPESKESGAKMEALLEQLEPLMEEGNKVLVFSQFVELLALLKPAIAERGWRSFYLAGETENRGDIVKEFQKTEGEAVFLISLKAGGFGLNLTAASYVVLFDPWWNPAVENQAIDRTHRIGQVNKVIAYRLLIKDSVEEKIRSLQKQKSALALDVLGEEKFAQSLSLEDLQFLFS